MFFWSAEYTGIYFARMNQKKKRIGIIQKKQRKKPIINKEIAEKRNENLTSQT